MGGSITYDEVAIKLNEWYSAIKKDQITDAEFLKADVKRLFDSMEENQTVLLYFSLLEFRHDLMLSYLKPKLSSQELDEYMVQINEQKHKIDQSLHEDKDQIEKMLDFYFWFFKGMHEFRKKQFDEAISSYKSAEKVLLDIEDPTEKAEFYYKLSEVYYHIDQYQISVMYAHKALSLFTEQPLMQEKIAWCYSVIAGNYLSKLQYADALTYFEKSHSFAQQTKNEYLISSTIFNLGKCYFHLEKYTDALSHFDTSCELFEKNETSHVPKAYFNKLYTLLKLGQVVPAAETYEKGVSAAQQLNDKIYEEEMKFLYCLYFQSKTPNAITKLKRCLDNIQSKNLYEDVYQLAFEAAQYYNKSRQLEIAVVFYERALEAKSLIQGGELLNVEE
ncbi:Rap family tetratricopeptide repeat protein [Bacillus pumilus]|uniref:Rap family tetratricopeptide repeat protein n=1 Tax=Bacillus pumilus TaxID=1408 RepID=UPI0028678A4F|nr:Rap family tetratricopeptide repeat protein [Bacillus pumilus]MDR7247578.1 tetratricopeptide (TPR) repeat protein [Bacillus pumilus]